MGSDVASALRGRRRTPAALAAAGFALFAIGCDALPKQFSQKESREQAAHRWNQVRSGVKARLAADRLDAGNDLDEERMHQVGDDDADGVTAAKRETARDGVALIAKLFDFGEDTASRGLADVAMVVEDLGDGHDRDAELAGDAAHRGSGHGLGCLYR